MGIPRISGDFYQACTAMGFYLIVVSVFGIGYSLSSHNAVVSEVLVKQRMFAGEQSDAENRHIVQYLETNKANTAFAFCCFVFGIALVPFAYGMFHWRKMQLIQDQKQQTESDLLVLEKSKTESEVKPRFTSHK